MKIDSGRLKLVDGVIRYESETYGSWSLAVNSLRLVGECTNQNGPFADDYFLVFLPMGSNDWLEASFYCEGSEEFLREIAEVLPGFNLLDLVGSTDFASRVLWPVTDGESELFEYQELKRGNGLFARFLDWVIPLKVRQTIREEYHFDANSSAGG